MALYTLTLRTNLENFLESIIYILYIISKLGKSGVQHFKRFANRSWNEEVMAIWRQLHQAGGSFRNDFEIQVLSIIVEIAWVVHDVAIKGLAGDDTTFFRYVHDEVELLKNHKITLGFDVSLSMDWPRFWYILGMVTMRSLLRLIPQFCWGFDVC